MLVIVAPDEPLSEPVLADVISLHGIIMKNIQGPHLLIWINFNSSMHE